MKTIVKSIKEVPLMRGEGKDAQPVTQDVEIIDEHTKEGTGKHERKPIISHVEVELVDEQDNPVAKHVLRPEDPELKDLREGEEYQGPHSYEHAEKSAAE